MRKILTGFIGVVVAITVLAPVTGSMSVAADQLRTRDRLKDGSCIAADQLRTRDRLKDGSCIA